MHSNAPGWFGMAQASQRRQSEIQTFTWRTFVGQRKLDITQDVRFTTEPFDKSSGTKVVTLTERDMGEWAWPIVLFYD